MTAAAPPPRPTDEAPTIPDEELSASIRVATEGDTVVIAVAGDLDLSTGEALIGAAEAAVATGPSRLDIDLRALEDFDEAGAGALASCRELGTQLAEGLHYRTGRGPGRDALLAAYSELDGEIVAD